MTSMKSSANSRMYSSIPYFKFYLKQNWQKLVLFLILALFILLLPSYITIQNELQWIHRSAMNESYFITQSDIIYRTQSNMRDVAVIGLFVCGGLALFSGMTAMSYVNSKKNVGCYHSFPIKRESMFLVETVTPLIYFVFSIVSAYALSYVMFFVSVDGSAEFAGRFFGIMLAGILLYVYIYTAILLAGSLTGTDFMKLLTVLIILFLPVALYAIITVLLCDNSSLYASYYLSIDAVKFLAPVINYIYNITLFVEEGKIVWASTAILSLVMYIAAMALNKYRKSELSGTTVIWKPVFIAIKYVMIFLAAVFGTWIFYYIGDESIITMFFGMVFGGVIGLVLMNCIMYRSTRAMFKDFKKFLICMGITFLFIIFVPLNATGMIGKPYSANFTKSLTLKTSSEFVLEDKNEIKDALYALNTQNGVMLREVSYIYSDDKETMDKLYENFSNFTYKDFGYPGKGYYSSNGEYYDDYGNRAPENDISTEDYDTEAWKEFTKLNGQYTTSVSRGVTFVQKPYFGIPLAKRKSLDTNSTLWDRIYSSEAYARQYDYDAEDIVKNAQHVEISVAGYSEYLYGYNNSEVIKILNAFEFDAEKRYNHTLIGYVSIGIDDAENYYEICLPVYSCDVALLNAIGEFKATGADITYASDYSVVARDYRKAFREFDSEEDVINFIIEGLSSVALVNVDTSEAVVIEDNNTLSQLISAVSSTSRNTSTAREFVKSADTDYILILSYRSDLDRSYSEQESVHFRPNSITNEKLAEIFESAK